MAQQTDGLCVTGESAAQLTVNRFVAKQTTGLWDYAGVDGRIDGVVIATSGNTAPYLNTIQLTGVAQVESDGSGAIAIGDPIAQGATNQCKKRAVADGTTTRYWGGVAQSAAAATQALLVDVLLRPHWASNS